MHIALRIIMFPIAYTLLLKYYGQKLKADIASNISLSKAFTGLIRKHGYIIVIVKMNK